MAPAASTRPIDAPSHGRYTVKSDRAEEKKELVRAVYEGSVAVQPVVAELCEIG
jgi:hypothetical protein